MNNNIIIFGKKYSKTDIDKLHDKIIKVCVSQGYNSAQNPYMYATCYDREYFYKILQDFFKKNIEDY